MVSDPKKERSQTRKRLTKKWKKIGGNVFCIIQRPGISLIFINVQSKKREPKISVCLCVCACIDPEYIKQCSINRLRHGIGSTSSTSLHMSPFKHQTKSDLSMYWNSKSDTWAQFGVLVLRIHCSLLFLVYALSTCFSHWSASFSFSLFSSSLRVQSTLFISTMNVKLIVIAVYSCRFTKSFSTAIKNIALTLTFRQMHKHWESKLCFALSGWIQLFGEGSRPRDWINRPNGKRKRRITRKSERNSANPRSGTDNLFQHCFVLFWNHKF